MQESNFEGKFNGSIQNIIKASFNYVNNNAKEVELIYVFGAIGDGDFAFNVFYKINGRLAKTNRVNTISTQQYDISDQKVLGLLDEGTNILQNIDALYSENGKKTPTDIKIIYDTKTEKFETKMGYDQRYYVKGHKTVTQVFNDWFVEMGGKL